MEATTGSQISWGPGEGIANQGGAKSSAGEKRSRPGKVNKRLAEGSLSILRMIPLHKKLRKICANQKKNVDSRKKEDGISNVACMGVANSNTRGHVGED